MALDERRVFSQAELKESYLIAERHKARMFATLNRVRQSLEDQGAQAQPVDLSSAPVSSNRKHPPLLWMPHGPAGSSQRGLQQATSQETGSASIGVKSVNQVHGLTSPPQKAVRGSHASAAQGRAGAQRRIQPSKHTATAESSKSQSGTSLAQQTDSHQQPSRPAQPGQHASTPLQHAPPEVECMQQEQQQQSVHKGGELTDQQAASEFSQHSSVAPSGHGCAATTSPAVGRLNGVRMVLGGWQARLGKGHTKLSLGTYPTEYAAARAYDRALLTQRPAFEVQNNLNFPVSDYITTADPHIRRAASAAASQLHRVHANKRRRQGPETRTSPHPSAPATQHKPSEHGSGTQLHTGSLHHSSRSTHPTSAKTITCELDGTNLPSRAAAVPNQRGEASYDSRSAEHPAQQSSVRTDPLNSQQKTFDEQLEHDSAQAGYHPHRDHVSAEPSMPQSRGPAGAASQGAGLDAHADPVRSGECQDQARPGGLMNRLLHDHAELAGLQDPSTEQEGSIPVKQLGRHSAGQGPDPPSHSAPAQHATDRLSEQTSPTAAGPATTQQSLPPAAADLCAEKEEAQMAVHEDQKAVHAAEKGQATSAEEADHAAQQATPAARSSEEQSAAARQLDDLPSTAPPEGQTASAEPDTHQQHLTQQPPPPASSYHSGALHAQRHTSQNSRHRSGQAHQPLHAPPRSLTAPSADAVEAGTADTVGSRDLASEPADTDKAATESEAPRQDSPEVVETVHADDSDNDVEIMDWSPVRPQANPYSPSSPPSQQGLPDETQAQAPQPQRPEQEQSQHAEQRQHCTQQADPGQQHQQQFGPQPVQQKADLSMLSDLASLLLANHRQPQHMPQATTAVKQEARSSQSHNSAHMPDRQAPTAMAGSTTDQAIELSESEAEGSDGVTGSSTSSSVDPSQRVPAPWVYADTAASRQSMREQQPLDGSAAAADGHVSQTGWSSGHVLPARALLGLQSQGAAQSNGQLRTKRGWQQGAAAQEGTRSKLARVGNGLSVGGRMPDCNSGASAAQAVNLSDDDDDVVIIEEGMQPQAPHTHTASAKQPGFQGRPRFVPKQPAAASRASAAAQATAQAAAARSTLYSPSTSTKPPPVSSTLASTSAVHSNGATRLFTPVAQTADFASASQAAPSVVPAVVRPSSTAGAQPTHQAETDPASAAADTAASASAAGSVAELRRTEQQLDVGFRAAQDLEWQKRDAEIGRQAEEARRLKRQRKAANEKAAKQQAQLGQRLAEHRLEERRKEEEQEHKERLRVTIRHRLALQVGSAKSLHSVLRAFNIPVDGGFAPTQAQLQKAYKKATIMFHPDKHVRAGLQKQLEAEETFKIISHAGNRKPGK